MRVSLITQEEFIGWLLKSVGLCEDIIPHLVDKYTEHMYDDIVSVVYLTLEPPVLVPFRNNLPYRLREFRHFFYQLASLLEQPDMYLIDPFSMPDFDRECGAFDIPTSYFSVARTFFYAVHNNLSPTVHDYYNSSVWLPRFIERFYQSSTAFMDLYVDSRKHYQTDLPEIIVHSLEFAVNHPSAGSTKSLPALLTHSIAEGFYLPSQYAIDLCYYGSSFDLLSELKCFYSHKIIDVLLDMTDNPDKYSSYSENPELLTYAEHIVNIWHILAYLSDRSLKEGKIIRFQA